ncbi:H-NS histone family protein [Cereibacter sphaeroides]|uniref:H-NS histone family protein n=1 Tax=Cereibacter sphaeroides TaxID=1063 RepID=UPI001F2C7DF7|nr:H-NS histone family protein [Cereibacter sphaeroides]MCE6959300.1 H-NS histone family protein [Cereibacter sphaeroides]MCE6972892.1 H-NS histone family protein [Cereibacter sphaeroides]
MDIDLNSLTLPELKALNSRVAKAIATFDDRRRKDAMTELEIVARSMGFSSLAEVVGMSAPKGRRAPAEIKYRNPETGETWSGRGRRPRWFDAALERGDDPATLKV